MHKASAPTVTRLSLPKMATLASETTAPATAPEGMALFVADVPVNATVRITGLGSFEIVKDKQAGLAWPAGEAFPVPLHLADAFLASWGPQPGSSNVSVAGAALGRIQGLRRIA